MTKIAPTWFTNALESLRTGDLDGWMSMYDDDAVHEFPFAPGYLPKRVEGKDAIAKFMATVPATITRDTFTLQRVHATDSELVVEGTADGSHTATGEPFHMQFVWILTHQDGHVSRFGDYMNPLQLTTEATGATPAPVLSKSSRPARSR